MIVIILIAVLNKLFKYYQLLVIISDNILRHTHVHAHTFDFYTLFLKVNVACLKDTLLIHTIVWDKTFRKRRLKMIILLIK